MRHLRLFEDKNKYNENYCLFIAPKIHVDTINTFWTAVKYEYEGRKQYIIPITILTLISILKIVRHQKTKNKHITKLDILTLFRKCLDTTYVENSTKWSEHIKKTVELWGDSL
jgi:hypothetical protein